MGLSESIKDELARVVSPETLDALINLSIQLDRRPRERRSEWDSGPSCPVWMIATSVQLSYLGLLGTSDYHHR